MKTSMEIPSAPRAGSSRRTELLVSVRSAAEAEIALQGGADLIDVKEPRFGSLGAASHETIAAVARQVAGKAPVSAAMGELLDQIPSTESFPQGGNGWLRPECVPPGVALVKFGLAGCGDLDDWARIWKHSVSLLPHHVTPVAVIYADWRTACAPSPDEILEAATDTDCATVLVDTFDKQAGGLFDYWPPRSLSPFVDSLKQRKMRVVLAGSLNESVLEQACALAPDYIALRGALCDGDRSGPISLRRVRHFKDALCHVHQNDLA